MPTREAIAPNQIRARIGPQLIQSVLRHDVALGTQQVIAEPGTLDSPNDENIDAYIDAQLRMVFLGDAMANSHLSAKDVEEMPEADQKSLWVPQVLWAAQQAKRINPDVDIKRQSFIKKPHWHTMLYDEMHLRRGAPEGAVMNNWHGREYAGRVALGEIVLMDTNFER